MRSVQHALPCTCHTGLPACTSPGRPLASCPTPPPNRSPVHPSAPLPATPQVLKDVGMDASQADELMTAASGAPSSAGTTPRGEGQAGGSSGGGGAAGQAGDGSGASSRTISYEDFRRLLLSTPPSIITRVRRRFDAARGGKREVGRRVSRVCVCACSAAATHVGWTVSIAALAAAALSCPSRLPSSNQFPTHRPRLSFCRL